MRYELLRALTLFGKVYWWDRQSDGRLTLRPAMWLREVIKG